MSTRRSGRSRSQSRSRRDEGEAGSEPESALGEVVAKLAGEPEAEAIVLAPFWPTQPWFATLRNLADDVVAVHAPGTSLTLPRISLECGSSHRN